MIAILHVLCTCVLLSAGIYSICKGISSLIRSKRGDTCAEVSGTVTDVKRDIHSNTLRAYISYSYNGKTFEISQYTKPSSKGGLKAGDTCTVKVFASDGRQYCDENNALLFMIMGIGLAILGVILALS